MIPSVNLTLPDLGDVLYKSISEHVKKMKRNGDGEIAGRSSPLQESIYLNFPEGRNFFMKAFPHRNL